jgi:spore maturation protein SpmB
MFWSGFAVLLIWPAAVVMICIAVLLESSGIMDFLRALFRRIFK